LLLEGCYRHDFLTTAVSRTAGFFAATVGSAASLRT
jgi:hypothetical protein